MKQPLLQLSCRWITWLRQSELHFQWSFQYIRTAAASVLGAHRLYGTCSAQLVPTCT